VKCLRWCEFGSAATDTTSCSGCGEAVAGVGDDELSLQLGQDGEHAEHGSAFGSGGIDSLLEIDEHGNDRIEWRWATVPPATVPLPPAVGALAYARCTLGTTQASLSNAMCPWLGE